MSTDLVIPSDYSVDPENLKTRKATKKKIKSEPSSSTTTGAQIIQTSGVMVIPADPAVKPQHAFTHASKVKSETNRGKNVKVIAVAASVDIKANKQSILNDWRAWKPEEVVAMFKLKYDNLKSLSVMLSRFKTELAALKSPLPAEYLKQLALSATEYGAIKKQDRLRRKRGAMSVVVISNADAIVLQALQYITSSNPKLLYAALIVLTGMRPIEIARAAEFSPKLNQTQEHKGWWACQTKFAKRGKRPAAFNPCRDRPFLAPSYLIMRALEIVRRRWPCKKLSSVEVNRKYSTHWQKILTQAYPMLPGLNARLMRRFFACYSWHYFHKGMFIRQDSSTESSLVGYASWVLGHQELDDQIIAYQSLRVDPAPKLELFQLGRALKVPSAKA